MFWRGMLAAFTLGLSGCPSSVTFFQCVDDDQCGAGVCEPNEYCSFPNEACPSGRIYGEEAAPGIAGQCVPIVEPGSTGSATSQSTGAEVTTDTGSSSVSGGSTTQTVTTTTGLASSEGPTPESDEGTTSSSSGIQECSDLEDMQCVQCAIETECSDAGSACAADRGCTAINECLATCGDEDCALVCCSFSEDKGIQVFNAYIGCIADACALQNEVFTCP